MDEHDTTPPLEQEPVASDQAEAPPVDEPAGERQPPRDTLGLVAVIAGVLLLSPVAIVLGHLSLRRTRRVPGASRTLGLAGVILGYLGLVVTVGVVAVYLAFVQPAQATATADAHAQADVTAIGNAVAAYYETASATPRVLVAEGSYTVGSEIVESQLEGEKTVAIDGESRIDWCVELTYTGGDTQVVSYVGTSGFQAGSCN